VDETYQLVQYNGTVGWPSPYAPPRGEDPTPEIDAAWNNLNGMSVQRFEIHRLKIIIARPMSVPEQVVLNSGENSSAVRLSSEMGGGYLAWAEVNHQLHCLNLVRKGLHWDYYVNKTMDFQREPVQVQAHLGVYYITNQE